MSYVGRFAPSPTGPLHFGSLIAALASYLDARAHDGKWLVRIEDVDETRCNPMHIAEILHTLQVFGLQWDGHVEIQSGRKADYSKVLQTLRSCGLVYGCACSRQEIADSATIGPDGPVYPGTCRRLALAESGNAVRVVTTDDVISFTDALQGAFSQRLNAQTGDFVVKRRDGLFAYQLAVVADDAAQGVTHVVRGADLLDSTARQIYLQRLLGYTTPQYLHIPIAVDALGKKLSKQTLAAGVFAATDAPQALLRSALQFLGQSAARFEPSQSIAALLTRATSHWDRSAIPRARTRLLGA